MAEKNPEKKNPSPLEKSKGARAVSAETARKLGQAAINKDGKKK